LADERCREKVQRDVALKDARICRCVDDDDDFHFLFVFQYLQ
jgi:hypothetical protein